MTGVSSIQYTLREMCPYSEFFWSVFSLIRTEYGDIWSIFPYSVRIRENTEQNTDGRFSPNDNFVLSFQVDKSY